MTTLLVSTGCVVFALAVTFKCVLEAVAQATLKIGHTEIIDRATARLKVITNPLVSFLPLIVFLFLFWISYL